MRKGKLVVMLFLFCIIIVFGVGCSKDASVDVEKNIIDEPTGNVEDSNGDNIKENEGKVQSPISGIYTEEENIAKRPMAVMLDNQAKARPQAGLDQAEIVYEILAEGSITRYIAIFLINEPELIGPVRSARPYFIDKAMEYRALYVHVGGSPQAFHDIKILHVPDIDAMTRGTDIFWRKSHKKAPHNMYTSTVAIRKAAKQSKYLETVEYDTLQFRKEDAVLGGSSLQFIEIPYYKNYKPNFQYDQENKHYLRYINDKPHLDEVSNQHLFAKNIIIQKADVKVIDSVGRLEIDLVGKGSGYYISNGEMIEVTWEKKSRQALTRFFTKEGNEVQLNPGVTWIEVVPSRMELVVK